MSDDKIVISKAGTPRCEGLFGNNAFIDRIIKLEKENRDLSALYNEAMDNIIAAEKAANVWCRKAKEAEDELRGATLMIVAIERLVPGWEAHRDLAEAVEMALKSRS